MQPLALGDFDPYIIKKMSKLRGRIREPVRSNVVRVQVERAVVSPVVRVPTCDSKSPY